MGCPPECRPKTSASPNLALRAAVEEVAALARRTAPDVDNRTPLGVGAASVGGASLIVPAAVGTALLLRLTDHRLADAIDALLSVAATLRATDAVRQAAAVVGAGVADIAADIAAMPGYRTTDAVDTGLPFRATDAAAPPLHRAWVLAGAVDADLARGAADGAALPFRRAGVLAAEDGALLEVPAAPVEQAPLGDRAAAVIDGASFAGRTAGAVDTTLLFRRADHLAPVIDAALTLGAADRAAGGGAVGGVAGIGAGSAAAGGCGVGRSVRRAVGATRAALSSAVVLDAAIAAAVEAGVTGDAAGPTGAGGRSVLGRGAIQAVRATVSGIGIGEAPSRAGVLAAGAAAGVASTEAGNVRRIRYRAAGAGGRDGKVADATRAVAGFVARLSIRQVADAGAGLAVGTGDAVRIVATGDQANDAVTLVKATWRCSAEGADAAAAGVLSLGDSSGAGRASAAGGAGWGRHASALGRAADLARGGTRRRQAGVPADVGVRAANAPELGVPGVTDEAAPGPVASGVGVHRGHALRAGRAAAVGVGVEEAGVAALVLPGRAAADAGRAAGGAGLAGGGAAGVADRVTDAARAVAGFVAGLTVGEVTDTNAAVAVGAVNAVAVVAAGGAAGCGAAQIEPTGGCGAGNARAGPVARVLGLGGAAAAGRAGAARRARGRLGVGGTLSGAAAAVVGRVAGIHRRPAGYRARLERIGRAGDRSAIAGGGQIAGARGVAADGAGGNWGEATDPGAADRGALAGAGGSDGADDAATAAVAGITAEIDLGAVAARLPGSRGAAVGAGWAAGSLADAAASARGDGARRTRPLGGAEADQAGSDAGKATKHPAAAISPSQGARESIEACSVHDAAPRSACARAFPISQDPSRPRQVPRAAAAARGTSFESLTHADRVADPFGAARVVVAAAAAAVLVDADKSRPALGVARAVERGCAAEAEDAGGVGSIVRGAVGIAVAEMSGAPVLQEVAEPVACHGRSAPAIAVAAAGALTAIRGRIAAQSGAGAVGAALAGVAALEAEAAVGGVAGDVRLAAGSRVAIAAHEAGVAGEDAAAVDAGADAVDGSADVAADAAVGRVVVEVDTDAAAVDEAGRSTEIAAGSGVAVRRGVGARLADRAGRTAPADAGVGDALAATRAEAGAAGDAAGVVDAGRGSVGRRLAAGGVLALAALDVGALARSGRRSFLGPGQTDQTGKPTAQAAEDAAARGAGSQ